MVFNYNSFYVCFFVSVVSFSSLAAMRPNSPESKELQQRAEQKPAQPTFQGTVHPRPVTQRFNQAFGVGSVVGGWGFFAAKGKPWGRYFLAGFLVSATGRVIVNEFVDVDAAAARRMRRFLDEERRRAIGGAAGGSSSGGGSNFELLPPL